MAHIRSDKKYTVKKDKIIYVLTSPTDKRFYVGVVSKGAERNRYKDHFTLRISPTNEFVSEAKRNNQIPNMYLLESVNVTEVEGYSHRIAWTRYFLEHGFQCVDRKKTIEYANDLIGTSEKVYADICEKNIGEVLTAEHDMFPNYGQRKKHDGAKDFITISFRVTPGEAEKIKALAREKNCTMAKYCRDTVLDGTAIHVDYDALIEVTEELREVGNRFTQMIYVVSQIKNYYPEDLKEIQNMRDEVVGCEQRTMKEILKTMKYFRKNFRGVRKK